ncbi:MAG TPA: amidohydrolase family protein [Vicinamibacterales bacterium]|nr:amidohydrolase family protein [Vicinamibacterales bacterium]
MHVIIDTHCHYTTEPQALHQFRDKQLAGLADAARKPASTDLGIPDDVVRKSVEPQLALQKERSIDLTIFSPRAAGMAHHVGTEATSQEWTTLCNNLIHRVCSLWPENFAGVGQLPQAPGAPPANCIPELERIVNELGFVGVNLNPDPTGGRWSEPPLTDRQWYPLYEKLCELDVPATIHVSSSCNRNFHHTGAHYINADTTAFMQLIQGDLFSDFPTLKLIIPHGGGAVPFHWGRYRGLCLSLKKKSLLDHVMNNVVFDTCVYHLPGIELLTKVVPAENILFATEMLGAVPGIDPETGHHFDDTKRYIDQVSDLTAAARQAIFEKNARRVFPRLNRRLAKRGYAGAEMH